MRVFVSVLILVTLGLSLVPCCVPVMKAAVKTAAEAGDECCKSKTCHAEKDVPADSGTEENGCNTCSPFFVCGSCVGFTLQNLHGDLFYMASPTITSYSAYEVRFDSEYVNKKWQPPKIAWIFIG